MKKGSNYIQDNKPQLWLRVIALSSCLAILFNFFFVFAQTSQTAVVPVKDREVPEDSKGLSWACSISDQDRPLHFPFAPVSLPPETESLDEYETGDNFDDGPGKLSEGVALREKLHVTSGKCLLQHLSLSGENRTEVSLFILHHSWKSFLI